VKEGICKGIPSTDFVARQEYPAAFPSFSVKQACSGFMFCPKLSKPRSIIAVAMMRCTLFIGMQLG
jgi:hypothetical protein